MTRHDTCTCIFSEVLQTRGHNLFEHVRLFKIDLEFRLLAKLCKKLAVTVHDMNLRWV